MDYSARTAFSRWLFEQPSAYDAWEKCPTIEWLLKLYGRVHNDWKNLPVDVFLERSRNVVLMILHNMRNILDDGMEPEDIMAGCSSSPERVFFPEPGRIDAQSLGAAVKFFFNVDQREKSREVCNMQISRGIICISTMTQLMCEDSPGYPSREVARNRAAARNLELVRSELVNPFLPPILEERLVESWLSSSLVVHTVKPELKHESMVLLPVLASTTCRELRDLCCGEQIMVEELDRIRFCHELCGRGLKFDGRRDWNTVFENLVL